MSFLRHGEIFRSDELAGEQQTGCRSPLIVSMSFRLAIPGGLLSSRARFRFANCGALSEEPLSLARTFSRQPSGGSVKDFHLCPMATTSIWPVLK
jgi:hypothetical protein